jgi:CelD/BcsL family acetyltransferase involved in cellulose biosynthesis
MRIEELDPIRDPRWQRLLLRHPRASIFHTPGWLEALRRTYGYEPAVLASCTSGGELAGGLVFCRVKSPLTGCRAVSLPFSDHCEPLTDAPGESARLADALAEARAIERLQYAELRPVDSFSIALPPGFGRSATFWLHRLDLRPGLDQLYRGLHKDCVRRKLRRAERESLEYVSGQSESLLQHFYRLMVLTRRRHGVLPQPFSWFRSLADCLGDALTVRLALEENRPIAAVITLRHKRALVYKYGCSDARFNSSGGMQALLWRAIVEATGAGLEELDLGRTGIAQPGLAAFKDRLGGARSELAYWRSPAQPPSSMEWPVLHAIVGRMPPPVLAAAGRLFYRHFG